MKRFFSRLTSSRAVILIGVAVLVVILAVGLVAWAWQVQNRKTVSPTVPIISASPLPSPVTSASATPTAIPTATPTASATPDSQAAATDLQNGQSAFTQKQYITAISDYQLALAAQSGDASAQAATWDDMGNAYRLNGQLNQAISAYKSAISQDSTLVTAYVNLANVYVTQNDQADAQATLTSGLTANPGNTTIVNAQEALSINGTNVSK